MNRLSFHQAFSIRGGVAAERALIYPGCIGFKFTPRYPKPLVLQMFMSAVTGILDVKFNLCKEDRTWPKPLEQRVNSVKSSIIFRDHVWKYVVLNRKSLPTFSSQPSQNLCPDTRSTTHLAPCTTHLPLFLYPPSRSRRHRLRRTRRPRRRRWRTNVRDISR
jgi:hypothetical protein